MRNPIILLVLLLMLGGCAQTQVPAPTTGGSVDASERQTETSINNSNNTGNITQNFYLEKAQEFDSESTGQTGATVSAKTVVETPIDTALSQAKEGGTLSLAEEGAELLVDGVESMWSAFEQSQEENIGGGDKPVIVPPDPEDPEEPTEPTPDPDKEIVIESGIYWGRHNGDRPTWYFKGDMKDYPVGTIFKVEGGPTFVLKSNNGTRYETTVGDYKIIVKQSDVTGRGLALVVSKNCMATKATLTYTK